MHPRPEPSTTSDGREAADDGPRTGYAGIAALIGLALLVGLVAVQGVTEVWGALAGAGPGLLWVVAVAPAAVATAGLSWRAALRAAEATVPPGRLLLWSWIGLAVNWLLPVAQVGGEGARAHLAARHGVPPHAALASVLIDKTLQVAAQALTTVTALLLLMWHRPGPVGLAAGGVGAVLFALAGVAFFRAQHGDLLPLVGRGLDRFARGARWEHSLSEARTDLVEAWREWGAVVAAFAWRLAFRTALVVEVWIALRVMGVEAALLQVLVLEWLGQAFRAAAFVIPGGLGAQEGGFALVASLVGLPPAVGLAASLAKRVREVVVGVPALVIGQALVGPARSFRP